MKVHCEQLIAALTEFKHRPDSDQCALHQQNALQVWMNDLQTSDSRMNHLHALKEVPICFPDSYLFQYKKTAQSLVFKNFLKC